MDKMIGHVLKYIRERRDPIQASVADGTAKDYADYKAMCGEIRGLTIVEQYLLDLDKQLERFDD